MVCTLQWRSKLFHCSLASTSQSCCPKISVKQQYVASGSNHFRRWNGFTEVHTPVLMLLAFRNFPSVGNNAKLFAFSIDIHVFKFFYLKIQSDFIIISETFSPSVSNPNPVLFIFSSGLAISVPRYDQPPPLPLPITYQPRPPERNQPVLVPANPYHTAEIPDWLQVYARAPLK